MSTALKCPNPSCPYLFDPSRVPAGVVLTCPRCAMRFTLGPPVPDAVAAAPTQTVPPGHAVPPQPPAAPGYPPAPPPTPAAGLPPESPPAEPRPAGGPPRVRPASTGEGGPAQTLVIVVMVLALMGGVAGMVYFRVFHKPDEKRVDPATLYPDLNLAIDPPDSAWTPDDDIRSKLKSPYFAAFRRTGPEAFAAFGGRNYDVRAPRLKELQDGLTGPLNILFENVRPEPPVEAQWLGQPAAVAYTFRAQARDGTNVQGQCYAVGHKGYAYWAVCWAAEGDAPGQAAAFDALRAKVRLAEPDRKWTAKGAAVRPFRGHALDYEVLDAEEVWKAPDEKERPPTGEDPKADLLLAAKLPKQPGRDFRDEATLVVMILDAAGGEPLDQGKGYVLAQRTDEVKGSGLVPKFTDLTGEPEGDPVPDTVERTASVARVRMTVPGAKTYDRLLVVSAIRIEGKVVVAYGYCQWADRSVFEGKLVQITGSLREVK